MLKGYQPDITSIKVDIIKCREKIKSLEVSNSDNRKPIPKWVYLKGKDWEIKLIHKEYEVNDDGLLMWKDVKGIIPIYTDNKYIEDYIKVRNQGILLCSKAHYRIILDLLTNQPSCYYIHHIDNDIQGESQELSIKCTVIIR